jgi:hypothetical protein
MRLKLIALMATMLLGGCSNLVVHKIPLDSLQGHCDDKTQGFRYYLSRPYVAVMKPIPLTTTQVLVALDASGMLTFLDGPQAGEKTTMEALRKTTPGSSVTAVPPAELERLRTAMQGPAFDHEVEPAQYRRGGGINTQNTIISTTPMPNLVAAAPLDTNAPADNTPKSDGSSPGGGGAPSGSAVFTTEPATATRSSVSDLQGDIKIVFLPDMDEQYAIESRNVFSKSSFGLQFRHGWELTDVSGNHDSTPVALELFATINAAVDAAKALSTSSMSALGGTASKIAPKDFGNAKDYKKQFYILKRTTVLKPGIYRINKPSEMEEGAHLTGCGLLAKLGLETFTMVEISPYVPSTSGGGGTMTGKISDVDAKAQTITISPADGTKPTAVTIPDNASITIDGKSIKAADFFKDDTIKKVKGSTITIDNKAMPIKIDITSKTDTTSTMLIGDVNATAKTITISVNGENKPPVTIKDDAKITIDGTPTTTGDFFKDDIVKKVKGGAIKIDNTAAPMMIDITTKMQ